MSSLSKRIGRWFLKRFNVVDVSEKAGIEWLTVAGMLGDRIQAMEQLTEEKDQEQLLQWSAAFFRAALPWFTTREDKHMRKKLIAWLDNYEIYTTKIKPVKDGTFPTPGIYLETMPENPGRFDTEEMKKYEVELRTSEVDRSAARVREFLISDAKILLADSFKKKHIAAAATYVVSKSEVPAGGKEHGEAPEGWQMIGTWLQEISHRLELAS